MNENLKVSTIITTYRRADMLKRAIDSVLNQTYSNIEVIVAVSYTHLDVYKRQE